MPIFGDPVLQRIAARHPGMRPHASGSLFDGLIDSIVGQSITVLAAAVVSARLASYFHPGIEVQGRIFWPAPRAGRSGQCRCGAVAENGGYLEAGRSPDRRGTGSSRRATIGARCAD